MAKKKTARLQPTPRSWSAKTATVVVASDEQSAKQTLDDIDGTRLGRESARVRIPQARLWPEDIVAFINENLELLVELEVLADGGAWRDSMPSLKTSADSVSMSKVDFLLAMQVAAQAGFSLAMARYGRDLSASAVAASMMSNRKAGHRKGRERQAAVKETLSQKARRMLREGMTQKDIARELGRSERHVRRYLNGG